MKKSTNNESHSNLPARHMPIHESRNSLDFRKDAELSYNPINRRMAGGRIYEYSFIRLFVPTLSRILDKIGTKNSLFVDKKGFSLIEVLISSGIVILVGTLAFTSFLNSRNAHDLVFSGEETISIIRLAQSRALAGEDNAPWGVHLESSRVVLFQGSSYAGAVLTDPFIFPERLELVDIALAGGGQDLVFSRLDGKTNQAGSFLIRVKDSVVNSFSITVDSSGKAYRTGTAPLPVGTRIADARHRTFTLTGTIKNSLLLKLTFSDPPSADFIYTEAMAPAAPRASFDWMGTVSAFGQNQTLRIHALSITDAGTALSVDRDCRKNTKKVKISFDGNDVAAYEADCKTITVLPFGGTAVEP